MYTRRWPLKQAGSEMHLGFEAVPPNLLLPVSELQGDACGCGDSIAWEIGQGICDWQAQCSGTAGPSAVPRKPLVLLPVCPTEHTAVRTSASDKPAKIGDAPAQTSSLPEHVARLPYQKEVALLRPNAESF